MSRIEQQDEDSRVLARNVLTWAVLGRRPLNVVELSQGLAMIANPGLQTITDDDMVEGSRILSVCAGLIAVDSDDHTVRLIHYTAQQYFDETWKKWLGNAPVALTRACVRYLLTGNTDLLTTYHYDRQKKTNRPKDPFLGYAAQHWGNHVADVQTDLEMQHLGLTDLFRDKKLVTAIGLHIDKWWLHSAHPMSLLAHFNLCHLATEYLKQLQYTGMDECSTGFLRATPLMIAAWSRSTDFVGLILAESTSNVNATNLLGETALIIAASKDKKQVVETLLNCPRVDLDTRDNRGSTALMYAMDSNYDDVVRLLLERWRWTTVLCMAADAFDRGSAKRRNTSLSRAGRGYAIVSCPV